MRMRWRVVPQLLLKLFMYDGSMRGDWLKLSVVTIFSLNEVLDPEGSL